MNDIPETIKYDVNRQTTHTQSVDWVLAAVLVLAAIGVAAAAIANRTAQGQAVRLRVMPANTMLHASLNTHTDQPPTSTSSPMPEGFWGAASGRRGTGLLRPA
jgi:hypothetical protein